MTNEIKEKIAHSFSSQFEEFELNIKLSVDEFRVFEIGIYSRSMDEKWNVFTLGEYIFWARSWTNCCMYKIRFSKTSSEIILTNVFVTADNSQYNYSNIQDAKKCLLLMLQFYLNREDFYISPEMEYPLINRTITTFDPYNQYKKSIGHNTTAIVRIICSPINIAFSNVSGCEDLLNNINAFSDNEELLSLHLKHRSESKAITFYFNKEASQLLGIIRFNQ